MSEPAEPTGPEKPFVLRDHVTVFEFAQLAQSLDPELARAYPEEAYQKALVFLQGSAAFIERNPHWQAIFERGVKESERQLRSSEDYFRLNDSKDEQRLLDYLSQRGAEFKTVKRFLKAYDKEKLPSLVSRESSELRRSKSKPGQFEMRSTRELAKERVFQKWALDKFIELRQAQERKQDADRKREKRRGHSQT